MAPNKPRMKSLYSLFDEISYTYTAAKAFQMEKNIVGDNIKFLLGKQKLNLDPDIFTAYQTAYNKSPSLYKLTDEVVRFYEPKLTSDQMKQFRAFLGAETDGISHADHLSYYMRMDTFIKGPVNELEGLVNDLIKKPNLISDSELALLDFKFADDLYIHGKISEAGRNRVGFESEFSKLTKFIDPDQGTTYMRDAHGSLVDPNGAIPNPAVQNVIDSNLPPLTSQDAVLVISQ